MPKTIFSLNISEDEILKYYSGAVKSVITTDTNGLKIQFPAAILRQFVTKEGVHGTFEIEFDENGRMQNITKL